MPGSAIGSFAIGQSAVGGSLAGTLIPTPGAPNWLDDGGAAATASGIGQVAGVNAYYDLGATYATARWDGVAVYNVETIDTSSGDETYSLIIEGSTTSAFTTAQTLAIITPGAVGQQLRALSNQYSASFYRYIRLRKTLAGTTPNILLNCFVLPLTALDALTTDELLLMVGFAVDNFRACSTSFGAWQTGVIGGGPNSDGVYPLTDGSGDTIMVKCPAQQESDLAAVKGAVGEFNIVSGFTTSALSFHSPRDLHVTLPSGVVTIDGARVAVTGASFTLANNATVDFWAASDGTITMVDNLLTGLPFYADKVLLYRMNTVSGAIVSDRTMSQSGPWIRGEHSAGYRPRDFLRDFVITTGDYAGAWAYGLNNGPENYFGAIAMTLVAKVFPAAVKAYLKMLIDKFVVAPWVSQGNWTKGQHIYNNGYVFIAQNAGQSTISNPFAGSHGLGTTVTDGAVTWKTVATVPTEWVWWICDHYNATGIDQNAYRAPDSNDAYGAMFAAAVYHALQAGAIDTTWLNAASLVPSGSATYYTRAAIFQNVVFWNCRFYVGDGTGSPASTTGMSQTFQAKKAPSGAAYDVQFTQDNLEVFYGLTCAASVYTSLADSTNATACASDATSRSNAVMTHYSSAYGLFKSNNTETFASVNTATWYPFAQTQLMSVAYALDQDYLAFKTAVDKVFNAFPRWWKNAVDDFPTIVEAYECAEGAGMVQVLQEAMTAHEELFIQPHDGRFLVHHAAAYIATSLCIRRIPPSL